ncbi:acyl-CoA synthetase (AMP-forming)/AMP-acid ligase II [Tamaricihabitans halophyticus]|uniref:Acyl-CoA synthetase (AMP-forming)/AMP-acid ligase II n=1 Tax=Tamaricihabitans halophyticus TaxID=1262583 RepID=A0A4R2QNA1_9PSEU|nr:class I adenylate-forming enzyme family protein [Tamaricihabitans halophyticus]TCP50078.1 acyl-CoA synthetase (AMP-forming)/AMP-acid ligase II [Tamaricihabitans halophyticus]
MAGLSEPRDLDAPVDTGVRDPVVARLTANGGQFEIVPAEIRGIPMRVYSGGPQTLREVAIASREFGDRDFLVYADLRWSFAEHYRIAVGLAQLLRQDYGLRPGDRVAIAMRNYPEWGPVFWATQLAGLIAVPLNAWWLAEELVFALRDSGATLLVADAERIRLLASRRADLDGLAMIEVRGEGDTGARNWRDVLGALDLDAPLPDVGVQPEDDATILYTSGTTGRPKGAIGSHRNHCTNIQNTLLGHTVNAIVNNGGAPPEPAGPEAVQPGALLTFPIFHIAGITGLCFATFSGTKLVTMYRWDSRLALDLVVRERLSGVNGVPTVIRELLAEAAGRRAGLDVLGGLAMGGAPIPPDLVRRIDGMFATTVAPSNGYGLTETTSAVVSNSAADYVSHPDSVGRCMPGADLRVVDPATERDVPEETVGELWFRGPNVVRGYWNNPDASAAAFVDGWFRTGDLGYQRGGWVYVVDRLKDVVVRGGENVYCAEVEAVLFEHPAVADVAIVGIPDDRLGEEVAAVIRLEAGRELSEDAVREYVAGQLASFKVPSTVLFWTNPLPRTPTGKVLKRDLRTEITVRREAGHVG